MVRSVRRDNRMASTAARRSPRTRVRSDASMATSVPVPIARPRSAWARAAASLTPSPTIATTLPSACSRLTTSTLSAGNTSAMTRPGASALPAGSSVMPTSAATARATVELSPVSSTGVRPSARSSATAWRLVGLTASATASTPRAAPSQPTATAVRPAACAAAIACARSAGRSGTRSASSRARPTYTVWPSTTPCTPTPSTLPNPVTGGSAPTRSAALAAMARAMGCSDPASSAPAGADQQRGRRGQAKRARAGDDEHRDGSGERRGRPGAGTQPEPQRCDGDGDDDRHEHGRDAVGQPLHRGLAGLRLLNQAGHLRELRVRADPSGPYHEPAAGVDRGPDDHVAGADLHRPGLTGEHRVVHRRCTGLNHAVSGDLLPGPYHERDADGELLDRHPHLNAAAEHGHVLGAELEQRA